MNSVIALRTNDFDPAIRENFERLRSAGMPMFVAADERERSLDTAPFPKASLTDARVSALGLPTHKNVGWLCGDFFLYLVAEAAPEAEYIWLLEPDIRFHFADPSEFFAAFTQSDADLITVRFDVAPSDWYWSDRMAPFGQPVHLMLFSALRVSRRAVAALLEARRLLPDTIPAERYPNDEAFVATTLANHGFSCRTFSEFGRFSTAASFNFWRPISGRLQDATPTDGLLYHPVIYGEKYLKKAHAFCRRFPTHENIEDMLVGVARELGADAAATFLKEARRYLPPPVAPGAAS